MPQEGVLRQEPSTRHRAEHDEALLILLTVYARMEHVCIDFEFLQQLHFTEQQPGERIEPAEADKTGQQSEPKGVAVAYVCQFVCQHMMAHGGRQRAG